ncbi:hypothetical protein [Streptomyces sp. NPDC005407]|uniref:hypothetical protein n=1 Tax=Streptomyces sp. NPDC005407 TaxID=3155340 RepID=UPI0033BB8E4C
MKKRAASNPHSPWSRASYAYVLRRQGQYENAAALLLSLRDIVGAGRLPAVWFNTGLALLQAGHADPGAALVDQAVTLAVRLTEGEPEENDLPCVGVWMEQGALVEDPVTTTYPLLKQLLDGSPHLRAPWALAQYERLIPSD